MRQRPLSSVPRWVLPLLACALLLQVLWHAASPHMRSDAGALPPAPSLPGLQLASLGEPIALSKAIMLMLHNADGQGGASIALRELDYVRLRGWLARALDLDPRSQTPLLAASQLYAAVDDPKRVRLMLDLVRERFEQDPNRRWPWLAHAAIVARHRLHDLPLALAYAQAIRTRATGAEVPAWAGQLELLILEEMNETAAATALIGALLHSGQVSDPRELAFLERKLNSLNAHHR